VKKQIIEKLFNTGGGINFDSGTALGKSRKNRKAKKVNINVIMNNNLKKRFDCKRDWNWRIKGREKKRNCGTIELGKNILQKIKTKTGQLILARYH
jgi:hypothetical protein